MKTFRSFAKLNLHLEVLGRRADGYHDLRTVFQTIDLADELRLAEAGTGVELAIAGADLPADRRNLAWRAAEAFLERFPGADRRRGVRIELDKRIPVQGGLGGGSSNAATVLLGLARLRGLDPGTPECAGALAAMARELGADVPFFLLGGTAVGEGRGDRLTALDDGAVRPLARGCTLWLAVPRFGVSTREAFEAAPSRGVTRPFPALAAALSGRAVSLDQLIGENDLEGPAFAIRPELQALYTCLVRSGAKRVRMSGSGSTLFALYDDPAAARPVADLLPSGTVWMQVATLGRAEWRRAGGLDSSEGGS
ncbi:MAG: 4-(cytidine 5'-diphospho)-2-C-methyl-D-erythritol kinase [Thermoanaerobaculia bacterium]|nr:MAG: 4-(cytidine 5'-diphospho)-2-C-methyl-D-erythritol kinase [Thermoanaerobaculia bacterium]